MNQQGISYWAIVIVLAVVVASAIVAFWPQDEYLQDGISSKALWKSFQNRADDISEKAKIEKWIVDSKLNQYGDPADTLYTGGTPLFDEVTGEMMDKYDYIKQNHPDKPWDK